MTGIKISAAQGSVFTKGASHHRVDELLEAAVEHRVLRFELPPLLLTILRALDSSSPAQRLFGELANFINRGGVARRPASLQQLCES